jgi:peptide/nickel transport system permease protein
LATDTVAASQAGLGAPEEEAAGYWAQSARRLLRDPAAVAGAVLVVLLVLAAAIGPVAYGRDPNLIVIGGLSPDGDPLGPSKAFPLGTDTQGRDVLARLLNGAKVSLAASLLAIAISAVLGIVLGGFAGVGRGAARQLLMRVADVILSFPVLLLAMVFLAITKPSLWSVAVIIGLGWGAYLARIVFGIVHSLAGRDLAASAVAIGASRTRLLFRHLLPHALPAVIVYMTLGVGVAIQAEAVFGYLGVGLPPPDASWGNMIAEGQGFFITQPRLVFVPAGAILLAMLAFVLLGDGLRHALDPKDAARGGALETRRA